MSKGNVFVHYESFPNFEVMLSTLSGRPNNDAMAGYYESDDSDSSFSKTKSYNEAIQLLRNGYTDILPKVKNKLDENDKLLAKLYDVPKAIQTNSIIGYAPNVPNAIKNLPQSMIFMDRKPRKQKTLSIIYFMCDSWFVDADDFVDAGTALVSAINIIERNGIQTKLMIGYEACMNNLYNCTEAVISDVVIKDYGQRFNLQKICFPLAHPSMFRRIGFKYLETCPCLRDRSFSNGYGYPIKYASTIKALLPNMDKNNHIFTFNWIQEHDNQITEIIKELGVI